MPKDNKKIAIIGGGASGVAAALTLATRGASVTIFERNERLLAKFITTGNGKGNLANANVSSSCYNHGEKIEKHLPYLYSEVVNFYKSHGVALFLDEVGRLYPYSKNAKASASILISKLEDLGVDIRLNTNVDSVSKKGTGFLVNNEYFDYLILSVGSSASISSVPLDNNNSALLSSLALETTSLVPVLGAIKVKENLFSIENERRDISMSLYKDGRLLATEIGEVHFRKNALSGVITFIISSHLVWAYKIDSKAKHDIRINFLSSMSEKEIKEVLKLDNPIRSLFSERIAHYLEGRMKKDKISLSNTLTNLSFTPIIKNGALFNHVTNGGVKLELIDLDTLSSTKDSHLFVVGEVLDIDGLCGGYNLMFAIYSGIVAARHILTEVVN